MSTMKAAFFEHHGDPRVLRVGELPSPVPEAGEVLLRVRASALNHIDLWMRRGLPRLRVPLPHVGGADVCGEIVSVGAGVHGVDPGLRVLVNPGLSCGRCIHCQAGADNLCAAYHLLGEHVWGGHAELVVVPATNLVPAPADLADALLAAAPVVYLTAWHMLVDRAALVPGETVLIWGAGSGVGTAAIQIAKLHGARVIAAASTHDKRLRAQTIGADDVVDSGDDALVEQVRALTAGAGANVVFEHTGAATFARSVRAAARGGRIVTCGATSGPKAELDLRHVFWRQLSILGATMAPRSRLFKIVDLMAQGRLRPVIDRMLPLSQIAEAHRALEARQVFGKIVFTPG